MKILPISNTGLLPWLLRGKNGDRGEKRGQVQFLTVNLKLKPAWGKKKGAQLIDLGLSPVPFSFLQYLKTFSNSWRPSTMHTKDETIQTNKTKCYCTLLALVFLFIGCTAEIRTSDKVEKHLHLAQELKIWAMELDAILEKLDSEDFSLQQFKFCERKIEKFGPKFSKRLAELPVLDAQEDRYVRETISSSRINETVSSCVQKLIELEKAKGHTNEFQHLLGKLMIEIVEPIKRSLHDRSKKLPERSDGGMPD